MNESSSRKAWSDRRSIGCGGSPGATYVSSVSGDTEGGEGSAPPLFTGTLLGDFSLEQSDDETLCHILIT